MLKWRPIIVVGLTCAALAGIALWVVHARQVDYWLQLHTGTINEPGPYYGFWSGFGSDLEEFGILGGIAAGVYQLVKKHNCHEPGCWQVGQYPAADGQFMLCYRHHPDYRARKPTHELIERLHREHLESQAAIHGKLHEAHNHRTSGRAAAHDPSSDVRHGATRPSATASPDLVVRRAAARRLASTITFRDGRSAGFVIVTGQILMAAHIREPRVPAGQWQGVSGQAQGIPHVSRTRCNSGTPHRPGALGLRGDVRTSSEPTASSRRPRPH